MRSIHEALKNKYSWYRSWHLHRGYSYYHWGILLVFILLGTIAINNQIDPKFELATTSASNSASIELDIPDYLPNELKKPTKIFSGRTIRVPIAKEGQLGNDVFLQRKGTTEKNSLPIKKKRLDFFTVDIPFDTNSGAYEIFYSVDGQEKIIPLEIEGPTPAEQIPAFQPSRILGNKSGQITYRTTVCLSAGCYWEMVFTGNPSNPSELFHNGGLGGRSDLHRSVDGGRTWNSASIESLVRFPYPSMFDYGDPKFVALDNGSFLLSGLFLRYIGEHETLGGLLLRGSATGSLESSIFQDTLGLPSSERLAVDYPKLAVDPISPLSMYISGWAAWFEDTPNRGEALYISSDGGRNFLRRRLETGGKAITSMTVGADGTLYAACLCGYIGQPNGIFRFNSFDPISFDTLVAPGSSYSLVARISTTSNRGWAVYNGPEIIADTNPKSPYYGRLYQIWSQADRTVTDPAFEYGQYSFNFDVFVSYSDDRGDTWSNPSRVNDDKGTGDQVFPSAQLDSNGVLHVAFIDHRDNQDYPVFDVYYAHSTDGITFSENLKLTDHPVANPSGGRSIGDYLDMIKPYPGRVFISFPCGPRPSGPSGACMVEVAPVIGKP